MKVAYVKIFPIVILGACVLAVYIFLSANHAGAQIFRLFPEVCEGGFDNVEHAAGVYNTSSIDPRFMTIQNSAVVSDGRSTKMICHTFSGEVSRNTTPRSVSLHIAWKYGYDKERLILDEGGDSVSVSSSGVTTYIEEDTPSHISHDTDSDVIATQDPPRENGDVQQEQGIPVLPHEVIPDTSVESSSTIEIAPTSPADDNPPGESMGQQDTFVPESEESIEGSSTEIIHEHLPDTAPASSEEQDTTQENVPSIELSIPIQETPSLAEPQDDFQKTESPVSFLDWFVRDAYAEEISMMDGAVVSESLIERESPITEDVTIDKEAVTIDIQTDSFQESLSIGSSTDEVIWRVDERESLDIEQSKIVSTGTEILQEQKVDDSLGGARATAGPIEVLYSFDGNEWASAGFAHPEDYSQHIFPLLIASSTTWEQLSHIQIALQTHAELDGKPIIIIVDGMWLEVGYEDFADDPHPYPSKHRGDTIIGEVEYDSTAAVLVERPLSVGSSSASTTELWLREGFASSTSWKFIVGGDPISTSTKIFFREGQIIWIGEDRSLWVFNPLSDAFDSISIDSEETTEYLLASPSGEKTIVLISQPNDIVAFAEYIPTPQLDE